MAVQKEPILKKCRYLGISPAVMGVSKKESIRFKNANNSKRDTTNTTWKKNITVMSISKLDVATPMNSWKPYQAWLLDGKYPFVRRLYALLNDPRRGLPWGFAHFIEQPKGQLIVFKSGLLPIRGEIMIRDVNVKGE